MSNFMTKDPETFNSAREADSYYNSLMNELNRLDDAIAELRDEPNAGSFGKVFIIDTGPFKSDEEKVEHLRVCGFEQFHKGVARRQQVLADLQAENKN